jgi:ADP-ribosylglycohydrolase
MSLSEIRAKFGAEGIGDYSLAYGRRGAITDDTQMTLFTAEGLLRASSGSRSRRDFGPMELISAVRGAYLRWLATQGEVSESADFRTATQTSGNGWMFSVKELHSRRAPGLTCLAALKNYRVGSVEEPLNDSKGCGGVMQMAPVGLVAHKPDQAFVMGWSLAALTHGHSTGYLAAGAFAAIICGLHNGMDLTESVTAAQDLLKSDEDGAECTALLELAVALAKDEDASPEAIEKIGKGWTAGEALAIGVYAALAAGGDFSKGVLLAVNHSGDSDSTGSIAGNILGMMLGVNAIPSGWLQDLELREVISAIARDLHPGSDCWSESGGWRDRYPG